MEQHNKDIADRIQRETIARANAEDAAAAKAQPSNYKTEEFYERYGQLVDEFATTHEKRVALFAARASGELPPIVADDADTHLERAREQLQEWEYGM